MMAYTLNSSTFNGFLCVHISVFGDGFGSAFIGSEQLIRQGALAHCFEKGYTREEAKGILKAYPENFSLCCYDSNSQKRNEDGGLVPNIVYKPIYDEEADRFRWEMKDAH